MKRQISTFLVLILCFCAWAEPVKAAETSSGWINVLDFASANNSGSNLVYYAPNTSSERIVYDFSDYVDVVYIDILFRTDSTNPSVSRNWDSLTVELVNNDGYNLFRAYGRTSYYGRNLTLDIGHNNGSWVDFISIRISTVAPNGVDIEAYCSIVATDVDQTIHYVPTDTINHRIFQATDDFYDTFFISYVWTEDWKKYDIIDFQLMFDLFEITSVSGIMGSTNVPVEVSYIDGTAIEGNSFYVTFTMDVSNLDKSIDDYPMIVIMGRLDAGKLNSIDFANASGRVQSSSVSPLALYFQNVRLWIQQQTADISEGLSGIGENISENFASLSSWIRSQTTSIQDWMTNQTDRIRSFFDDLEFGLESWIQSQTRELSEVFLGDQSAGDDFQQDVADKDQELEDMADVMDSVTKPPIDQINVNFDTYISPNDVNTLAAPLLVFMSGDIFGPIIVMTILMATVSYVLFGKR